MSLTRPATFNSSRTHICPTWAPQSRLRLPDQRIISTWVGQRVTSQQRLPIGVWEVIRTDTRRGSAIDHRSDQGRWSTRTPTQGVAHVMPPGRVERKTEEGNSFILVRRASKDAGARRSCPRRGRLNEVELTVIVLTFVCMTSREPLSIKHEGVLPVRDSCFTLNETPWK